MLSSPSQATDTHIHSDHTRCFTMQEAVTLLPLVRKITDQAATALAPVQKGIQNMVPADPRLPALMVRYQQIVSRWQGKMLRLGLFTHGLWQVGFDNGDGWWSWQHPERGLRYFQDYDSQFCERRLIRPEFQHGPNLQNLDRLDRL